MTNIVDRRPRRQRPHLKRATEALRIATARAGRRTTSVNAAGRAAAIVKVPPKVSR
jgi:hypothetical protein